LETSSSARPELAEKPLRHICPKLGRWFDRLTMSGLVRVIIFIVHPAEGSMKDNNSG
jgi:hypothetical protein